MRIVVDTNVLVRAAPRAAGPARRLLHEIRTRSHSLILSDFILDELRRVLAYPRVQALFHPALHSGEIDSFLADLRSIDPAMIVAVAAQSAAEPLSADP